jgi:lipopolysaccharide/colanic/teichoic acid biosynthesis glycosyltransferase
MLLHKIVHAVRRVLGLGERVPTAGFHAPGDIQRILERERTRADRTGDPLAVVTFASPSTANGYDTLAAVANALRGRIRLTDEVGWLDDRQFCAVLPGTGQEGARKVAEDVCLALPENVPTPVCTVFVYPGGQPNGVEHVPEQTEEPTGQPQPVPLETLLLRPMPLTKRAIDVAGALVGLVLLSPLFVLIALAIKVSSPGPVFFRQRRSGRGGKPFMIYKFRTMVVDAEARKVLLVTLNEQDGPAFKIKKDPRVTRIGRFLRKTSLDELPQLWNVLKGDMSLVGPRPLPCAETEACEGWQRRRLDVTPGITCIWQVRGRSAVSFDDWVRMDVQYIRQQSLPQDLKLLLLTVPAVLLRRGAH